MGFGFWGLDVRAVPHALRVCLWVLKLNQQTVVVSSGCLGYADKKRYKGLEDLLFDFGAACLSGVLRLGM